MLSQMQGRLMGGLMVVFLMGSGLLVFSRIIDWKPLLVIQDKVRGVNYEIAVNGYFTVSQNGTRKDYSTWTESEKCYTSDGSLQLLPERDCQLLRKSSIRLKLAVAAAEVCLVLSGFAQLAAHAERSDLACLFLVLAVVSFGSCAHLALLVAEKMHHEETLGVFDELGLLLLLLCLVVTAVVVGQASASSALHAPQEQQSWGSPKAVTLPLLRYAQGSKSGRDDHAVVMRCYLSVKTSHEVPLESEEPMEDVFAQEVSE